MNARMTWASKIWIAILLSCLASVGALVAQERPPESAALRVGVSPVFPPMVFKQGKELAGVEVDLAHALGEKIGRKVVFVELPWGEQIEALSEKRIDIIMSSMSVTMARRYVIDFAKPYLTIWQMILVRQEDQNRYLLGIPINLPGTVGVLKATTGDFLVQREFPKARRKVFSSATEAAEALKRKKIDLFISDSTLVWYLAGTHASDGLAVVRLGLSEEQLAWGIRKGDEKLLAAANDFVQKASQDGTLNRIFRNWTAVAP